MAEHDGFAIGVDLGTSNTVAVVRWPDGRTRPLLVDGLPIMPSGVYLDEAGRLHVGRDAMRMAQLEPARFEPNPKRRIDEPAVLLGDREVEVVDLLAAVLTMVARGAVEAVGFLPPAVLTFPAAWGQPRREKLVAAAARAGWPPVRLVPEPVAAARYFADVLRRPVPVGASLAVFDFGGGTLDVAVVRNEGIRADGRPSFSVLGSGGVEDLGGLDVDAALVEALGAYLAAHVPDVWRGLRQPTAATERRNRRLFWEDVRGAKEMLSRTTVAPIAVPGVEQAVHLTRDELERVATPLLHRAVYETAAVITRCGLRADELAGLFLVGGSSRLPVVARMLHTELGIAPIVLEQPELPVAEGALAELAPLAVRTPVPTPPVPPTTVPTLAVTPTTTGPTSGAPITGGTLAGTPVSAAPYATGPISGPPAVSDPPPTHPPAHPPAHQPTYPPVSRRRPWYRHPVAWIAATASVLAVALVVAAVAVLYDPTPRVEFATLEAVGGVSVPIDSPSSVSYTFTDTFGDRSYVAWVNDQTLKMAGIDLKSGKVAWPARSIADADDWDGIVALPAAVIAFGQTNYKPTMYVLDPANGSVRWKREMHRDDKRVYYDNVLVLASGEDKATRGLDWRTGAEKWRVADPADGGTQKRTFQMNTVADHAGPAGFHADGLAPDLGDDHRLLQVTGDKTLRVYDASTGKLQGSRQSVGDTNDRYAAYDGKLYVISSDSPYRVQAYDLDKLGEPQVVYTASDAKLQVAGFAPCGDGQLCLLDVASSDDKTAEVVSIDVAGHKQRWRRPAAGTNTLLPVGDRVLATHSTSTPASALYDSDGNQLLKDSDRNAVAVRINAGSLLLFSAQTSSYPSDVSLVGVQAADGSRTALGQLTKVRAKGCSWNQRFLVCPAEKDFGVWRFAA